MKKEIRPFIDLNSGSLVVCACFEKVQAKLRPIPQVSIFLDSNQNDKRR